MVAIGTILTAAQAVAQNETAQQWGMTVARRLGNGIYAKIFGPDTTLPEPGVSPDLDPLSALIDKVDALALTSATREEMAQAFTVLQLNVAQRQQRLIWGLGGLGILQIATLIVMLTIV